MRGVRLSLVSLIIAIGFAFQPSSAWGFVVNYYVEYSRSVAPYIDYWHEGVPVIPINVACYDLWKGEYADCAYELSLEVKERDSGEGDPAGHLHENDRPLGELRLKGDDNGGILLKGQTNYQKVRYE